MLTRPSWSPDGKWLAYGLSAYTATINTSAQVRIVSRDGGRRATVVTVPGAGATNEVAWSPDGKRIAFVLWTQNRPVVAAAQGRSGIAAVNIDTREMRPITRQGYDRAAAWSPDGTRLAFVRPAYSGDRGTIWTVDAHGGVPQPISRPGGYIAPVWCPAS